MANYLLRKEANGILREMGVTKSENLLCPILKVMQMRHKDIDVQEASKVIKEVLHS